MKILSLLLIVGAFIMGMKDGGDVTGAVVALLVFFAPILFERKGGKTNARKRNDNQRGCFGHESRKVFETTFKTAR